METVLAAVSVVIAIFGAVVGNVVVAIGVFVNLWRGIDRHRSMVPLVGQILLLVAGLISSFIPRWILWTTGVSDIAPCCLLAAMIWLFRSRQQ